MFVYECTCDNVKVLVVFVVFHCAHPVSRIPLNQHWELSCLRVLVENFSARARPKLLPLSLTTINDVISAEDWLSAMVILLSKALSVVHGCARVKAGAARHHLRYHLYSAAELTGR